ncbi:MAG: YdcF family protein [Rhodospirillaceae bacterium]|nr:YdcF family protein [Rhodospirillaceae bacterium]
MYSFIKSLALPPASLIILLALAVLAMAVGRRRLGFVMAALGVVTLYLLSTPFGAGRLASLVPSIPPLNEAVLMAQDNKPGAIVILSAGLLPIAPEYKSAADIRGTVDEATLQRLTYGAYLWRRFNIPVLVSGGTTPEAGGSLAFYMKESLEQSFGVPVTWVEERSRNTLENANFSAALLHEAGIKRVVLVTHAIHMPRAVRFFSLAGFDVVPAPTVYIPRARRFPVAFVPKQSAFQDSYTAIYEVLGTAWYRASKDDFTAPAGP